MPRKGLRMTHNMDTIRWSNSGRLEVLGHNAAVRWSLRLHRREAARVRLARRRRESMNKHIRAQAAGLVLTNARVRLGATMSRVWRGLAGGV